MLGEVPTDRFGPAVLEQVETWRADTSGASPECLRDLVARVRFVMNR